MQESFFNQKKLIQNNDFQVYYIPIVERLDNLQQLRSWKYARNSLVSRKFYTSTKDLFTQEGIDEGRTRVSCYKVILKNTQVVALNQCEQIGKARLMALSFLPSDIFSCINLSENQYIEAINPFYKSKEEAPTHPSLTA